MEADASIRHVHASLNMIYVSVRSYEAQAHHKPPSTCQGRIRGESISIPILGRRMPRIGHSGTPKAAELEG